MWGFFSDLEQKAVPGRVAVETKVELAVVCMQISSRAFSGFIVKLEVLERLKSVHLGGFVTKSVETEVKVGL